MQLVVGQDEVPQVHQALEVGVVQDGEAVGVQVERVEILEVGEGVRPDLADGVSAQGQVDLDMQGNVKKKRFSTNLFSSCKNTKLPTKLLSALFKALCDYLISYQQ